MAIKRVDEVLGKALSSDANVIPRYDVVLPNGNKVAENAEIVLKNPVVTEGMPINRQAMNECLAASGVATGTKKALVLAQEQFVLTDGALVRFKLFDVLSGAATLNINNTGAKRLKMASGDDPDGFVANTWVDAIYSAARNQYIIVGGGNGGAAMSMNINLLEEVDAMKYCKVLTNDIESTSEMQEWLSIGAVYSMAETPNYTWYGRVRAGVGTLEILRIHKTTGVTEQFTGKFTYPSMFFTMESRSADTDYWVSSEYQKLQFIPIRNGDCLIYYVGCNGGNGSSLSWNTNWYSEEFGLILQDGSVVSDWGSTSQSAMQAYYGMLNGYYDSSTNCIYWARPCTVGTDRGNANRYCGILSCYNCTSKKEVWTYTRGPSYNDYDFGRSIWVLNATTAIAFTGARYYNSNNYDNQSSPVCWKISLNPTTAPTTETTYGENKSFVAPYIPTNNGMGWYFNEQLHEIGVMFFRSNPIGASSDDGAGYMYINVFNYVTNTQSFRKYDNARVSQSTFYPGYACKPYVIFHDYYVNYGANAWAKRLYDLSITYRDMNGYVYRGYSTELIQGAYYTYADGVNKSTLKWDIPCFGRTSGYAVGDKVIGVDLNGEPFVQELFKNPTTELKTWTVPEDGIYKFIAVGGGANGADSYGGGSGYMKIATAMLTAGQIVEYQIGVGGLYKGATSITEQAARLNLGKPTFARIKGSDEYLIYAQPGMRNIGGFDGASTANGGGAGGYDLQQYGGRGMNFTSNSSTSVSVSSSSSTISVGNIALGKDRNGGYSANAGAVTSGDGYGAGGGMRQNGKDGCLVIIR